MQVSQTGCTEIGTSGLKVTCKSNKNQDPIKVCYHLCSACRLASSGTHHTQRSEFCGAGRCTNTAETRSLPQFPAGYKPNKRAQEDAGSAQAEGKAAGRLCSGHQAEILAHHGAHHIDLWPLALQDFSPPYWPLWPIRQQVHFQPFTQLEDKLSIQTAVVEADNMHRVQRSEKISSLLG